MGNEFSAAAAVEPIEDIAAAASIASLLSLTVELRQFRGSASVSFETSHDYFGRVSSSGIDVGAALERVKGIDPSS